MDIKLPDSSRRKALFIDDVQPLTLSEQAKTLIPFMAGFIAATDYQAYVDAAYFADEASMFYRQGGFLKSRSEAGSTAPEIQAALSAKNAPHITVEKNTRSCFKAVNAEALHHFLADNDIEEVHFIGYDINDCVLASAYDAIDLGYFSYVIPELCDHWNGKSELKDAALTILRRQHMAPGGSRPSNTVSI